MRIDNRKRIKKITTIQGKNKQTANSQRKLTVND